MDLMLAAYLLNPSAKDYDIEKLAAEYNVYYEADGGFSALSETVYPLTVKLSALLEERDQTELLRIVMTEKKDPMKRMTATDGITRGATRTTSWFTVKRIVPTAR